jgi:hypothetical protein
VFATLLLLSSSVGVLPTAVEATAVVDSIVENRAACLAVPGYPEPGAVIRLQSFLEHLPFAEGNWIEGNGYFTDDESLFAAGPGTYEPVAQSVYFGPGAPEHELWLGRTSGLNLFASGESDRALNCSYRLSLISLDELMPGDADRDGLSTSADFVKVFQSGQYEDGALGNSVWATGDWTADREFTSYDLIAVLQSGGYEQPVPTAAIAAIPEPSAATLMALTLDWYIRHCRRRRVKS